MSHDPIGERGGVNLYGMVNNDPVGKWDYLGLEWYNPLTWSDSEPAWYNPFSWGNDKEPLEKVLIVEGECCTKITVMIEVIDQ